MFRRSHFASDQILSHRNEIVIRSLAILLPRGFMPLRAKLTAATNVREHIHTATIEPGRADPRAVAWKHRNLKSAVSVKQGRVLSVQLHTLAGHLEIRNPRSVFGLCFVLRNLQSFSVEVSRQALQLFPLCFSECSI